MTTTGKKLPAHLHAAWDWTDAAGELTELRMATGDALEAYAHASAQNCRENSIPAQGDKLVNAADLVELHDWLVANEPE